MIHAAAKALRETPIMNATVSGESTVLKKDIHIAVAVDTSSGLLVPVLRHADRMSLKEISAAMDDFGARAKSGKISPDELSGGTFSITNPGIKGNLFGTPIINQPQVGILRLGQIVKRPVVIDVDGEDSIVIRPMMYLCCAYDHRVIDGVAGNGFLFRVREILRSGDFSALGRKGAPWRSSGWGGRVPGERSTYNPSCLDRRATRGSRTPSPHPPARLHPGPHRRRGEPPRVQRNACVGGFPSSVLEGAETSPTMVRGNWSATRSS